MSGVNRLNALRPNIKPLTDRQFLRGDIAFCHEDGCRLSQGAQGAYLTRRLGESCQIGLATLVGPVRPGRFKRLLVTTSSDIHQHEKARKPNVGFSFIEEVRT
jgi:hypothetical protein